MIIDKILARKSDKKILGSADRFLPEDFKKILKDLRKDYKERLEDLNR